MPGLLVLLAHPDDEFFCAGLLAAVAARGVPVHLAYWTRGEGGSSPQRRRLWSLFPRAWHPRVTETRRAAAILGAASLHFLDAIDPVPAPDPRAPREEPERIRARLDELFSRCSPELTLTHGSNGEYGHPAHVRLHQIVREWIAGAARYPLLSFRATWPGAPGANFSNADDPADFIFDSRPWFRQKVRLVRAHRSQRGVLESLARADGGNLRSLLRISRLEGYHCWSEGALRDAALENLRNWVGESGPPV
jgi:LmbE family N-acetylglucosaminyl deacetylase